MTTMEQSSPLQPSTSVPAAMETSNKASSDLPSALGGDEVLGHLTSLLNTDAEFLSIIAPSSLPDALTFGIAALPHSRAGPHNRRDSHSSGSHHAPPSAANHTTILIKISEGAASAYAASSSADARYTLTASTAQWTRFFQPDPSGRAEHSYFGLLAASERAGGGGKEGEKEDEACVLGDLLVWAQTPHLWRRALELLRDAAHGRNRAEDTEPTSPLAAAAAAEAAASGEPPRKALRKEREPADAVTCRYVTVTAPVWGRCRLALFSSGTGKIPVLFLHAAGGDSRMFHDVMGDGRLRQRCNMYAYDLPGHGGSFPVEDGGGGGWAVTEEAYLAVLREVVRTLGLKKPLVVAEGKAGFAVALRADEMGLGGVVVVQASDAHLPHRLFQRLSPFIDQSLWNAEWAYSLLSPSTPAPRKRLIYHIHASQHPSLLHGDLSFFASSSSSGTPRSTTDPSRFHPKPSRSSPLYILAGSRDLETAGTLPPGLEADKIPNLQVHVMQGLGRFAAAEDPPRFAELLDGAVEWVVKERRRDSELWRMIE